MNNKFVKMFFVRFLCPSNWNLNTRFYLSTGVFLIAGVILTLTVVGQVVRESSNENILSRLNNFENLIKKQQDDLLANLLNSISIIGAVDEINDAVKGNNRLALQLSIGNILNKIQVNTNKQPIQLQFFGKGATPIFNSQGLALKENIDKANFLMVSTTESELKPLSGIQLVSAMPVFSATIPLKRDDQFLGVLEATSTFNNLFQSLHLPTGYGITVLLDSDEEGAEESPASINQFEHRISVNLGITDIEGLSKIIASPNKDFISIGALVARVSPLRDFQNHQVGKIVLFYDQKHETEKSDRTINIMIWMSIIGVAIIMISLYQNLKYVHNSLYRLKLGIMGSHSGDYHAYQKGGSSSCLDLLNCDNDECKHRTKTDDVCYLSKGDRAIPPYQRNTCFHLEEYKKCKECPVYKMRSGDELFEILKGFDIMMNQWNIFFDKAGNHLSGVYGYGLNSTPKLEDVDNHLEQIAGLSAYSHDLHGVYSKDEVYNQLEWLFKTKFELNAFTLLEINSSENRMEPVLGIDEIGKGHFDALINCELCRAKRMAEDVCSENNPQLCPYFDINFSQEIRYCMPMVMSGTVGAIFSFKVSRKDWPEKKANLSVIKKYLAETAPTLSSLRLLKISKEQALIDPLTNCHNRRFMDEYLVQVERLHDRKARNIGFIMADLDHFKMVNDDFGHQAGDDVLKQLADILRKNIRQSDLLIRYGGEEFLIILMEIEQEGIALKIAEKLRLAVESAKLNLPAGGTIQKTLSMGVSEFPADADQIYKSIKYADIALYQAKDQGRNKVLHFTKDMWDDENY